MTPGNPLEHALVAAATEPSARPLFYRLLLESPLLILDASPDSAIPDGKTVLTEGTQVRAVCVEVEGVPHTVVFSSLAVLRGFLQVEQKYISMLGRDLLNLMRGSHLILNPGADYGKQILPQEIEAILNGAAVRGYATRVMQEDTQVLLGQPAAYPNELVDALSSVFRSRKEVRAAYLALCAWPQSREQQLMVGIDTSGDWEPLMRDISAALRTSGSRDVVVDFVQMNDSSVAQYMRTTRPFYKKKLLGLF